MVLAASLIDLIDNNHDLTNLRSLNTDILEVKWYKRNPMLFAFLARSYEHYSNPNGHLVAIKFAKDTGQMLAKDCRVACTCPAYLYWGSLYNATQGDYNYKTSTDIAPNVRDPNRERKVCKHIAAVRQIMRNMTGSTVHKKYKDSIGKFPSVAPKIKSNANTIPFDNIEVIVALQEAIPTIDAFDIVNNDHNFECALETLIGADN